MKLYVIVRSDLPSWQQCAVQGGHALAELLLDVNVSEDWNNGTLIYLKVENEKQLKEYFWEFTDAQYCAAAFHEPDLNDEMTAVAALGVEHMVQDLPLL